LKYVLDTNAVSALMRSDAAVLARLQRVGNDDVGVPQPVIAEIAYGIERLPKSKRRRALEERFELVLGELRRCVWTDAVSEQFGIVKAALEKRGERIEDFDAAIAAHALAESAVLVTSNLGHMARVSGLAVEDWGRDEPTGTSERAS
jgi:tRNA(fMet)-specific endonuclease VapC